MSCSSPGKVKHLSREAAVAHIRALYKAGLGNQDYHPYACDGGRHWHVGHSQDRLKERIARAVRVGNSKAARADRVRKRR